MPPGGDERVGSDFFRKEAPVLFNARFAKPAPPTNAWKLTSNIVFQAKNFEGEKKFTVKVSGSPTMLVCTVDKSLNLVLVDEKRKKYSLSESRMAELLACKTGTPGFDTVECQSARLLCTDHTRSSASSPLISGCLINNFAASKTYQGHKLHLGLKARTPFKNPLVSGLEGEYLLIGRVLDTDCKTVTYLGATNETKNELVNFFGSDLPRPAAAT
jgi:hypothetical protein